MRVLSQIIFEASLGKKHSHSNAMTSIYNEVQRVPDQKEAREF